MIMKSIVFITDYPEKYTIIANELYKNEHFKIDFVEKEKIELMDNCIYLYEINCIDDIKFINKKYPFLVISNIADPKVAIKCYKQGVLDCLLKPKSHISLYAKIKRYLVDFDSIVNKAKQSPEIVSLGFHDVITRDIKSANRGKYDYSVLGLIVENEIEEEVKDHINAYARETDTAMTYNENVIVVSMPFCDKKGTLTVIERLKASLKEKFKISVEIYGATLNVDGNTKEELGKYIVSSLSKVKKAMEEAAVSI